MELPSHVHKVQVKGRSYFYWHPWRGTARAEERVKLPDPVEHPRAFWAKVEALGGRPQYERGSISALVQAYTDSIEYDRLSDATKRDYRRYLDVLKSRWGEFMAKDIRPDHVRELRNSFADRPVTANHMVAVTSALFVWAGEHNWGAANPCAEVKRIKVESDGHQPWPDWAFEIAESHFRPELRRAYMLGRYTGQRLSDVLSMRLQSIDKGAIAVRQRKTGKELAIPIHRRLATEIAAARKNGRIYLVSRADGTPFTAQDFQAMWTREMAKEPQGRLRREGVSFHGLRKSAVATLSELGVTSQRISAITGQSLQVVEHYLKLWSQPTLARQAMDAWESAES